MRTVRPRPRANGFTLIELLVSLAIFGVIMTIAMSFLQVQTSGFRNGLERITVLQTLRYSLSVLEQDVQTAGTNTADGQPELVYAGSDVIAFNSDYATRLSSDPFAVFFDPDLEEESSASITKERKITFPGTAFSYPDSTYPSGAPDRSPAETIILFFAADTTTTRTDDYVLYRQVNDGDPQEVTRNLLETPDQPFFRYLRYSDAGLDSIPDGSLPIAHTVATHGSQADTGRVAMADSVRAVRVTLTATNGLSGEDERTAVLTRIINMPNVGFGRLETCGSAPLLGSQLALTLVAVEGAPAVSLSWPRATDEGGGENDVVRYVLYRRLASDPAWNEPYLSIPAGGVQYTYVDANVVPGTTYAYALAAQDCTPTLSGLSPTVQINVPN
jgi:prepilin-type N-terminal cleavage/methylation domain-containing protein